MDAQGLTLELVNPDNPQDYLAIRSAPGHAERGAQCTDQVTVHAHPGWACSTGAGVTVIWEAEGWSYALGGGLLSAERAVALANALELIDAETARARLAHGRT